MIVQAIHRRDLIVRAVRERDVSTLDSIVAALADAERTHEILRAKGYGQSGMTASTTAAQVPNRKD